MGIVFFASKDRATGSPASGPRDSQIPVQPPRTTAYVDRATRSLALLAAATVLALPLLTQKNWPNPQQPQRAASYDTGTNCALLLTKTQPPTQANGVVAPVLVPLRSQYDPGTNNTIGTPAALVPAPFKQNDWAVPPAAVRVQPRIGSATYAPIPASIQPVQQSDWPNPFAAKNQQPYLPARISITPAAPTAPPFSFTDWPNPQQPRFGQYEVGVNKTLAWGSPTNQTDWPNPQTPRRGVYEVGVNTTLAWGSPINPASQDDWPVPQSARRGQYDPGENRAIRIPVVAVVAPFRQSDWPNPLLLRFGQYEVGVNKTLAWGSPTRQTEWANPFAAKNQQPYLPARISVTPAAPTAPPFSFTDWPTPFSAKRLQPILGSGAQAPLSPALGAPFAQNDWPNPVAPARSQFDPGPSAYSPLLLSVMPAQSLWGNITYPFGRASYDPGENRAVLQPVAATIKPFAQTQWDNPSTTKAQQPYLPPRALAVPVVAVPLPPALSDWPNPQTPRRGDYAPGENRAILTPITSVVKPFSQSDWANPTPTKLQQPYLPPRGRGTPFVQSAAPFAQTDWGLPVAPPRSQFEVGQAAYLPLLLSAMPAQSWWNNPVTVEQRLQPYLPARTFIAPTVIGPMPFAQTDWPNPSTTKIQQPTFPPRGLNGPGVTPPTGATPFGLNDWPNPIQPSRGQFDAGQSAYQPLLSSLMPAQSWWGNAVYALSRAAYDPGRNQTAQLPPPVVVVPASYNQTDWQLPLRIKIQQPYLPQRVAGPPPPPPALPNSNYDWPNPIPPRYTQYAYRLEHSALRNSVYPWTPVVDPQTPGWTPVVDPQTPGWTPVVDPQTPGWTPVIDASGAVWVPVIDGSGVIWVPVADNQNALQAPIGSVE